MDIKDVLALSDIDEKIKKLKERNTPLPDTKELMSDWNHYQHEVHTDLEKYPKRKVLKKEAKEEYDPTQGKKITSPAEYTDEEVNRISVPIEQDIVNIHTAFTVGTEPKLDCTPNNDEEKELFEVIKTLYKKNKLKYQNKKIVRSWLSETEVAEYWYVSEDSSFWEKVWAKIKKTFTGKTRPTKKLKSVLWSPFKGDKLYPFFDEYGDLVAFSRGYQKKDDKGNDYECFMTITNKVIYMWENKDGWTQKAQFAHGLPKLPIIYGHRAESLCKNIKPLRIRFEKLLSSYADCIDYHFFPLLMLFGEVEGFAGKTKDRIVKLEGEGADAKYLVWNQAPETVKLELNTMLELMYSMTQTPRISFENLKGLGSAVSGTAFRFMFMAAHMAVENHAEEIGGFFQRRVNFLSSALGAINTDYEKASQTIDIDSEIIPYMIDSLSDRVKTAVSATSGGIWSKREGIMFAGNADRVDEELKEIEDSTNNEE